MCLTDKEKQNQHDYTTQTQLDRTQDLGLIGLPKFKTKLTRVIGQNVGTKSNQENL